MRALFRLLPVVVIAAAIAAVSAASSAPNPPRGWKHLRIATDGAYPPFSRVGSDGRVGGFDVEVAEEVCRRLEATCEIAAVGWDGLVPALLARRADVLVASIPITDASRRAVDFTAPYHRIAPRFVGRMLDAPTDPERATLAGVRVGVRVGTAHAIHLAAKHPAATVVGFPSEAAAGAALIDHGVDLVFGDTLALYLWLDQDAPDGAAGFVGDEVADPQRFGEGAGIAYRREDRDLGQLLDKALLDIGRDGTIDRLAGHWFPFAIR